MTTPAFELSIEKYLRMQEDPFYFIEAVWWLVPQEVLPEYESLFLECRRSGDYGKMKPEHFEPYVFGENITWQQAEIVFSVMMAVRKRGKNKISVASGHGIGKSTIMAMLILWYLFCYMDAKVPVTAPTQSQMYDVLWAEIQKWILKMPEEIKCKFEWQADYVRITERPETWFARARTGRKENPEALAGLHAEYMMLIVDEASGVPDPIFESSKSALTGDNVIFIMISNPTRLEWYFYNSHHKLRDDFACMAFSCEASPIVDRGFVEEIIREHGTESDQYRYRVLGKFPKEWEMDNSGYLPLLVESELRYNSDIRFYGELILGIDPSGEGKDMTQWVIRDKNGAKIVAKEKTSNEKTIAVKTLTLMEQYGVSADRIVVDNFGVGANVAQEMALHGHRVNAVNVGNKPEDTDSEYLNLRAMYYWRLRKWILQGGMLCNSIEWNNELPKVKWKRNIQNKLQIMPKDIMRKEGIKSPNAADALMLTFMFDPQQQKAKALEAGTMKVEFDPY